MKSLLLFVILGLIQDQAFGFEFLEEDRAEGPEWSYVGENGPETWSDNYPECAGKNQSPVEIDRYNTDRTTYDSMKFYDYNRVRSGMTLVNNGHTAQLQLAENDENIPCIEYGGLGAKYCFAQLHFHWGRNNNEGVEHPATNGGKTLEMHLVHVNPDERKNGNAGIAVLGITFNGGRRNNNVYTPITNGLKNIRYKGQSTTVDNLALSSLLPSRWNIDSFYRYNGSLTTPPCTEGVIWSVYDEVSSIGDEQMAAFRALFSTAEGETESPMAPNFRPTQPLNDRRVTLARKRGIF